MADAVHPDVPRTDGVPPLASYGDDTAQPLVTQDSQEVAAVTARQWGIYNTHGDLIVDPDNIAALEYGAEWRIADYPMEEGEFGSYNKVAMPYSVRVTMSKGGTLSDRQAFEHSVQGIAPNLTLYNVLTPEATYVGVNIERLSLYRGSDRGSGMLTYEIGLREIREAGEVQFDDDDTGNEVNGSDAGKSADQPSTDPQPTKPTVKTPKSPTAVRKKSLGAVQPKGPSNAEIARVKALGFKEQKDGSYVLTY
jgi:hypothetical protein